MKIRKFLSNYQGTIFTLILLLISNIFVYLIFVNVGQIVERSKDVMLMVIGAVIGVFLLLFILLNIMTLIVGLFPNRQDPLRDELEYTEDGEHVEYIYMYINRSTIPENDYSVYENERSE
jgi:hypothetical protein